MLNGVKIREFRISGNLACGIKGKVAEYRRFVTSQAFDLILIKAAQQWTFDAIWPVVSSIRAKKIFIPCGFSCLYEPAYAEYFDLLPGILDQFDHLIFYASDYRDINFARSHGIKKYSIIPNGASEIEFLAEPDVSFRQRYDIGLDDLLFLTVGSLGRVKGHLDVAEAFFAADLVGQRATLILNGNEGGYVATKSALQVVAEKAREYNRVINDICRAEGISSASMHVAHGVLNKASVRLGKYAARNSPHGVTFREELQQIIKRIHDQGGGKRVLLTDFPRPELVQAYMNADLFVFASHVEYSPLVLYESVAAATPFLSVPVGNAEEIARWTGAGVICPSPQDEKGHTLPNSELLAEYISRLTKDRGYLEQMGALGKKNWRAQFAWDHISERYENLFSAVISEVSKA
jgi:glycosyltransferase involved in cell wall biosynthesis